MGIALGLLVLAIAGTIAWRVWRARSCSQHGCGVQELEKPSPPKP
jgi:hypothetical protein